MVGGAGLVDGEVSGAAADFGTALVGSCFALGLGDPDTTICSTTPVNDGQWHHLAATRSVSSGKICVYVDGVLEVSGFAATSSRASPTVLRIGAIATDQNFFRGDLDDIRLDNYASLSSRELASLYTSGSGRRLCYSRPAWDRPTILGSPSLLPRRCPGPRRLRHPMAGLRPGPCYCLP